MGNIGNFEKTTSGLLLPSHSYKPFRYPWAFDFWQKQQQVHWMPEEVPLGEDLKDWSINLTDIEKNLLTQIFRFFTQSDVEVGANYMENYMPLFKPVEVRMMLASFSNMETIHIAAYALLLETIGMPDSEFSEGLQLFASFAMLMNFPRLNKMKGMGQIVTWSIRDESLHCEGMIKLFPLPWLTEITNGVEHANFFEARATEYAKGATVGSWHGAEGVWDKFAQFHKGESLTATE